MPAYKDTNGTYSVSFYYEDFRGVKKRKMKRGFARRRDALDWERRFLLQSTADLNMKFSDFVEIYVHMLLQHWSLTIITWNQIHPLNSLLLSYTHSLIADHLHLCVSR